MVSISKAFPGIWYKAGDLSDGPHVRTIQHAEIREVTSPWGPQMRCVMTFEPCDGMPAKYSCGKSVARTLATFFEQDDCDLWAGESFELFATEERIQGDLKTVIRVREA